MEDFLDILKYILPSGIVFATAYFILKTFLENENRKKMIDLKINNQNISLPIRLQAYERIILLLERISPGSVVMRVSQPGMTAFQLQTKLIQNIRDEFEHNLAQQVYVSPTAWELTKNAKEETIKLVNMAAAKLNDKATAVELGSVIFELSANTNKLPVTQAIEFIKQEVRQLY